MLAEIRAFGFDTTDIAFALNVPRGTIWSWENGTTPNYEDARAILKLRDQLKEQAVIRARTLDRRFSGTYARV